MIRGIIFDIDNTLTDFMKVKRAAVDAAVEGMIDAGLPVKQQEMVDKIFEIYWKEGVEDQKIFDKVLQQEYGEIDYRILAAGILAYRRMKTGSQTLYPHVKKTLITLMKMGTQMAVLSDAPKLEAWLRITGLGLQNYFDNVVTSEDFGVKKPDPKPFQKALELLGTVPGETLMVGDWPDRDIKGAQALGIRTCWAKYGDTFETKESGADYEIMDFADIIGIVEKENAHAKA